jgi:peptidoglycan hydrolase-like protein with peptidoglycan-binding domain
MTRWAAVGAVAVLVAGGGGAWWWSGHRHRHDSATTSVPVATATVTRTDLSSITQLSGTLGYAGSYSVAAQGRGGTITAVPRPGQVLRRGQVVYEVDSRPVYLFYGARPEWRTLALGVTDGPDVRQLEQNLTALGYADAQNLTVDDTFTDATYWAVRRWQTGTGQTVTGQIALGALTYQPGPLRVIAVNATLGAAAQPAEAVLTATSTTPVVTVQVPSTQTYLVHARDAVTVTLPDGSTTPGRLESISSVATGGANPDDQSQGAPPSQSSGSPQQPASVSASVRLTHPAAAEHLDQAPVTVNVTDRSVHGVLAVPITALVALAGGGYGVWVDGADGPTGRHLVGVTPGLFATTLVQVTARGLRVGDKVEVPQQ